MPVRYVWLHEAVAAAVRRKYPQLQVESDHKPGEVNGWTLDLKGGTKAERDEATEFARRFAEGWMKGKR